MRQRDIVRKLPHLRLAQVFDALSYYDDHRDEIERAIALNRVTYACHAEPSAAKHRGLDETGDASADLSMT